MYNFINRKINKDDIRFYTFYSSKYLHRDYWANKEMYDSQIFFNNLKNTISYSYYYVYILLLNEDIVYIGVTNDLNRRCEEHLGISQFGLCSTQEKTFNKVGFSIAQTKKDAHRFELKLIKKFNPKYNIMGKKVLN